VRKIHRPHGDRIGGVVERLPRGAEGAFAGTVLGGFDEHGNRLEEGREACQCCKETGRRLQLRVNEVRLAMEWGILMLDNFSTIFLSVVK